jgi:hypothetical protein
MKKFVVFLGDLLLSVIMAYCGGNAIMNLSSEAVAGGFNTARGIVDDSSCIKICDRLNSGLKNRGYFECYNFCDQQI